MNPPPPPHGSVSASRTNATSASVATPFFPPPVRITAKSPPPLRRQRTHSQSTPRPTPSSSSSTLDQDVEIEKAREASALRLLSVWSSLADRYTRGLDEDDVVDITTGEIIENRGVLAKTKKAYRVGYFANADGEETEAEDEEPEAEGSEGATEGEIEGELDDDYDELDTLSNKPPKKPIGPITIQERIVPPVQVDQAADAEDLRKFLQEERKRRERYGEEGEEEGDTSDRHDELTHQVDTADEEEGDPPDDRSSSPAKARQTIHTFPRTTDELDSEDELESNWQPDEASMVIPVEDVKRASRPIISDSESDSEIEFIGPPRPVERRSVSQRPQGLRPPFKGHYGYLRHLDTPPLTHSSPSIPSSSTPFDESEHPYLPSFSTLPPSSPPPSSPRSSPIPSSSPARSVCETPAITSPTPRPLRKPQPHSSPAPSIPRLDLSKLSRTPRFRTPSKRAARSPVRSLSPAVPSKSTPGIFSDPCIPISTAESDADSKRPPKNRVEVVISRRTPASMGTPKEKSRSKSGPNFSGAESNPTPKASKKGKEKTKSSNRREPSVDSLHEDSLPVASSSPTPASSPLKYFGHRLGSRAPVRSTFAESPAPQSSSSSRAEPSTSPEVELPPPRSLRKRKRISSAEQKDEIQKAAPNSASSEPDIPATIEAEPRFTSSTKPKSKSRQKPTEPEVLAEQHEPYQRLQSRTDFLPSPTNPGYFPPSAPHHNHQPSPSSYTPLSDPRVQFLMQQAVQHALHQYDALVHNPHAQRQWAGPSHLPMNPMSYLPPPPPSSTFYPYTSVSASASSPSVFMLPPSSSSPLQHSFHQGGPPLYHTPSTVTPMSSDTTDYMSSSTSASHVSSSSTVNPVRPKALVHRSRSRGRKVSFKESEEVTTVEESRADSPDDIPLVKSSSDVSSPTTRKASTSTPKSKGKGKAGTAGKSGLSKAAESERDSSPAGDSEPEYKTPRGRSVARAMTPGPTVAANARHDTKTGAKRKITVSDGAQAEKGRSQSRKR